MESDFLKRLKEEQAAEDAERGAWAFGEYTGSCLNCGRERLCSCPNGKHRCEKCNWVPEDNAYCPISNR